MVFHDGGAHLVTDIIDDQHALFCPLDPDKMHVSCTDCLELRGACGRQPEYQKLVKVIALQDLHADSPAGVTCLECHMRIVHKGIILVRPCIACDRCYVKFHRSGSGLAELQLQINDITGLGGGIQSRKADIHILGQTELCIVADIRFRIDCIGTHIHAAVTGTDRRAALPQREISGSSICEHRILGKVAL